MDNETTYATPPKAKAPAVELRRLVGYCRNSSGQKLKVTHPINQVLLRGRQVGTVGTNKGNPLNLLMGVAMSGPDLKIVLDQIQEERGDRPEDVTVPPGIPEGYSEEIVDEDDDE